MKLFDIFKKKQELPKAIDENNIQRIADKYAELKDSDEENPMDTTIALLIEKLKNSEHPEEDAEKLLRAAYESRILPDRMVKKITLKLADEISESSVANAIIETDANVPDELIASVIDQTDLSLNKRQDLIQNIDDDLIIREQMETEFNILYKKCETMRHDEIVERINDLKKILIKSDSEVDITDLIERVIARKMALNFYADNLRTTRIYAYTEVLPIGKMFERNLPGLVKEEFKKIEKAEKVIKPNRYNEEEFRKQILNEIGKNVGYKYRKSKAFIIPQSEQMQKISKSEEDELLRSISTASGKELTSKEKTQIKDEVRGILTIEDPANIIPTNNIPDKENNMEYVKKVFEDEEKVRTLLMLEKSGLLDSFEKLPIDARRKTITLIKESIDRRVIENQNENEEKIKEDDGR